MDMITLAMAKAYCDSKGGYENSYSMTFDGNTEGKVTIPLMNGVSFVKVSNKVLSKEELLGATYVSFDGKTIVIAEKNIFDNSAVGATTQFYGVMADNMTDAPTIVSCKACTIDFGGFPLTVPSDGTYFIYMMMGIAMYVSSLSNETIVPIDQKYLPGVCLPVVELTTEFSLDGAEVALTEAESKNMDKAAKASLPIVVSGMFAGGKVMYVFSATSLPDGTTVYNALIMNITLIITNESGAWVMRVESV